MDTRDEVISNGIPVILLINIHHDDSDMSGDGVCLAQSLVRGGPTTTENLIKIKVMHTLK